MAVDLSTTYAGMRLKHPLVAAATGATRDADHALRCEDAGFSAVVLKSVQEETLMRHNPFPRFAILESGIPGYRATTFYSYEGAYRGGIEEYGRTVMECADRLSIPVVASINCLAPERWAEYAVVCEQAGAGALEIVPSCPTGRLVRGGSDIHTVALEALDACRRSVRIPLVVKLPSQLANMLRTASALDGAGAVGLTIFNRPTGLDIDIQTMAPVLHGGFAGHGGPWALHAVLRWLVEITPAVRADVSATNGISRWEDAVKCLLAGARTVQVGTLVYLQGYGCVRPMLEGVREYLERRGIAGVRDIVGVAAGRLVRMNQYDRLTRYRAVVDSGRCTRCGRCEPVCIYGALACGESGPVVDGDACDGCGLCAAVCAAATGKREAAIAMEPS